MANLFWLGGTGANAAMAYARMQYVGLIPSDGDGNIRHFFIDSPENFGQAGDQRNNRNVGVNALQTLNPQNPPVIVDLTRALYRTFQDFMNNHPKLAVLYQGIPDYENIAKTVIKDGNYYMPAIASAMAHTELMSPGTGDNRSIICSSSYGGTGAGVGPFIINLLLSQGHTVDVIHLNHWLINRTKPDVERIIQHNEMGNITYIKSLGENLHDLRLPNNLKYYLFQVPGRWRQETPSKKLSNTTQEIANPYPYFIAACIARLLIAAQGINYPEGKFELSINPATMGQNPAFMYAYAYARLRALGNKPLSREFDFIFELMKSQSPHWGLTKIRWEKSAFFQVRDIALGADAATQTQARNQIQTQLFHNQDGDGGENNFDWAGFKVTDMEPPRISESIRLISYPTVFATYFYFLEQLNKGNIEFQEAYLALVACVITKRVYAEFDSYFDSLHYQRATGAMPFSLSDNKTVWGYVAKKGIYVWPRFSQIQDLRRLLREDSTLALALHQMHRANQEQNLWETGCPLNRALTNWAGANAVSEQPRNVWVNWSFFEEIVLNPNTPPSAINEQISDVIAQDGGYRGAISFKFGNNNLSIDAQRHNLFVIKNPVGGFKLLQYTNVLRNGNSKKIHRQDGLDKKLILNYRTVLDFSDVKYEVEILHPCHILANYTFEFSLAEEISNSSLVPWPLRKDYIDCLEPANGWYSDTSVNYPTLAGEFVDMRPHTIKNWGVVEEVDRVNKDEFLVKLYSTLFSQSNTGVRQSKVSYQGYVWPRDFKTKRFLKDWKYYSVMITAAPDPRLLANEIISSTTSSGASSQQEQWFVSQEQGGWEQFNAVNPYTHIGVCKDTPPKAIAMEYIHEHFGYYGAYFPIMPATPMVGNGAQATLGIDLGSSNTCSAVDPGTGNVNQTIQMNPSDLLYPVFANHPWQDIELEFGWVPYFKLPQAGSPDSTTSEIFPTGLCSFETNVWDNVQLFQPDSGGLTFGPDNNPHLPLVHFTIPGDKLKSSVRKQVTVYNLKWESDQKRRLVYWKDFLTTYLLFLGAHLLMGRQFNVVFNQIDIRATMPLKFSNSDVDVQNLNFEDMGTAFKAVLEAAAQDASTLSGLNFLAGNTPSYEAVAPLVTHQQLLRNGGVFVVVDVGGGTTDVAVLQDGACISTSSFMFAGNNPFAKMFPDDYMNAQSDLPTKTDQNSNQMAGSKELHGFLYLISAYTALLTGAAILQTGLKPEEFRKKLKICLSGQAWHLAQWHKDIHGHPNADEYVDRIIIGHLVDIFNNKVLPKLGFTNPDDQESHQLDDQEPHQLENSNILIARNAKDSKMSCSLGAIAPVAIGRPSSPMTFLGLSYGDDEVKWHENQCQVPLSDYNRIKDDGLCPSLLIGEERWKGLCSDPRIWGDANGRGDLFQNNFLIRNYVEYFLEAIIGGYNTAQRSQIKMDLNFINPSPLIMDK